MILARIRDIFFKTFHYFIVIFKVITKSNKLHKTIALLKVRKCCNQKRYPLSKDRCRETGLVHISYTYICIYVHSWRENRIMWGNITVCLHILPYCCLDKYAICYSVERKILISWPIYALSNFTSSSVGSSLLWSRGNFDSTPDTMA